ncbi:MAG: hypothetical protein ACI9HU_000254, partial [Colwellia sp.]
MVALKGCFYLIYFNSEIIKDNPTPKDLAISLNCLNGMS